jgi:hypothetical protein
MRLTIRFSLKAYQAVALDVIQLTHPRYTWVNKNFEVLSSRIGFDKSNTSAPTPYVELDLAETDSAIFDWVATEQLTPQGYKQPNNVGNRVCAPPEDVVAYSGPATVISGITYPSTITTRADGTVQNSIYVRWNTPNDANVVFGGHIEVQYQLSGATAWTGLAKIDPSNASVFIGNVTDGQAYNVQVRAVNSAGVPSDWISTSVTVSTSIGSGREPIPRGGPVLPVLTSQASGGGAQITVSSFTSTVGSITVSCTPSPSILSGLNQGQNYYVYYNDPTFVGGAITPIATQNTADYTGVSGAFLIGSVMTPLVVTRYQPSAFADSGMTTTSTPNYAYDNNLATAAAVTSSWWTTGTFPSFTGHSANGTCTWSGFGTGTTSSAMTLTVVAASSYSGSGASPSVGISVVIAGTTSSVASVTTTTSSTTYTYTIPSGTNLATLQVIGTASISPGTPPGGGAIVLALYEIYIS